LDFIRSADIIDIDDVFVMTTTYAFVSPQIIALNVSSLMMNLIVALLVSMAAAVFKEPFMI
jgi:hypothetical protein